VSSISAMSKFYDFNQLLIISEDDPEFRKELIDQYLTGFMEFPLDYAKLMRDGNKEELRFLIHKVKAIVRMVNGDELDRILQQSLSHVVEGHDPEPFILKVQTLCAILVEDIRQLT
jgi:hypothetical protein